MALNQDIVMNNARNNLGYLFDFDSFMKVRGVPTTI